MVVRRGFTQPPSYHTEQLRGAPVGHFYDVITNGWGRMSGYSAQIPVADRWAIVAYIRALQASNPNLANPASPNTSPTPATTGAQAQMQEQKNGGRN
jgi:mono/diheme cytochrome c family protein